MNAMSPPPSPTPRRRTNSLFVSVFSAVLLLAPLASGCARAKAKTVPEAPALDVPAPPARTVETSDVEASPPAPVPPPPAEPARRPPPRPRPAPPRQERSSDPRAEAPKADAPPAEAQKPGEAPATNLQTSPAGAGDVERAIHATLARATSDLNRVNYQGLNRDARTQYDTAKRFIEQADEAIREKNLVFARNLADKAAGLAAQLAGR